MHPFLSYAAKQHRQIIDLIGAQVRCESPSDSPADLLAFQELLIEQTRGLAIPERVSCDGGVPCLQLTFQLPGTPGPSRLLGLGHIDTVWPKGTLAQMLFREEEGRLWGPGVLDMKSGITFFIEAARLLRDLDIPVSRTVVLLLVPDEETGSHHSRALTEAQAQKSEAVLVLEPGTGLTGKLKTARKGIGNYLITVRGKAAHAGVDFDNGASAIVEIARQIQKMADLTHSKTGVTVNPGVISGGTRSNVIAAEASVEVDVRAIRLEEALEIDRTLRSLSAMDPRCSIAVDGGLNRPPMERTERIGQLYARALAIASDLGLTLEESATGGGSDGNFTAALGIPTLDGLGGVGEGAHADNESMLTNRIDDRVALLAGLMARL